MKFRILTLIITKLLGVDKEAEKADMHLPVKVAAFGLALILGGFVLSAAFIFTKEIYLLVFGIICFGLAPFTLLCYKNQRIFVISDEEFEYSTMFGRKTVYKFADIKSLRANQDSMTLFVADGKVHIESSAILSQRFMDLINTSLEEKNGKQNN